MAEFELTPSQDRAIHCIDTNVAVSAGAGSGKTRVLVQRFLYILGLGLRQPADTAERLYMKASLVRSCSDSRYRPSGGIGITISR